MSDLTENWGNHAVCPVCLWDQLKILCCADPKNACRIVLLSEIKFTNALTKLTGKCPHRELTE